MSRVYNFSAGPSMLPEEVLKQAADEMLDYHGCGQSVMEMSHRSKVYDDIIKGAEALLREIMNIPDNYKVLFLQGGASAQFSAIPLNFMNGSGKADYVITGQWAKKAFQEAQKYGEAKAVASSADKTFSYIPKLDKSEFTPDADYFYICMNNTIYGTVYHELPDTGDVPLIADISSCFLSEPIDVTKFGMLYGGAQKNVAPAGLVIAIIREDLLGNARDITPTMLNYKIQADAESLYNTPPCYTIYICKLVLEWIKRTGGLEAMKERNEKKAKLLYDYLDESKMFRGTVVKEDRSLMNVPFVTDSEELNAKFVKEATEAGLVNLKGHRTVGGMRASIYNAMPYEGVEKLVNFMKEFEKNNS
ncbi:MAG: 3-phosphoserine/phosphohydroxythreonine transaminase [Clostridiales bacterium]|nr:3-phosphoserine/phosphohydroxythreonine transaminase [Clostridia bacterium]MCR4564305.1 3-phosphoserine/phosphohydroxythreonine transaminase [Clostridiales bacterium]